MRRLFITFAFLNILLFWNCGGSGDVGDAGLGSSVIVTAYTNSMYVEQDIISNNDGSCEYNVNNIVIPEIGQIQITVRVDSINDKLKDYLLNYKEDYISPVSVLSAEYEYIPLTPGCPVLYRPPIGISALVDYYVEASPGNYAVDNETTFSLPVASRDILNEFALLYTSGQISNCEYTLKIKLNMKEVLYDRSFEKYVNFNVRFLNVLTPEECETTANP